MKKVKKNQQLLKILIGAAWLDGIVQPEERQYLRQMAAEKGVANDPDIKPILFELKPVKTAECYEWLEDYLGDNPSQANYESLLSAISTLIYSDGNVDTQEAKLLTRLQFFAPGESSKGVFDKLLKTIQKLYRQQLHQKI